METYTVHTLLKLLTTICASYALAVVRQTRKRRQQKIGQKNEYSQKRNIGIECIEQNRPWIITFRIGSAHLVCGMLSDMRREAERRV